ncbi:hypothetical protein HNR10_005859 [Nocardiopsis aegyptia]|uniref:Uncharacterized protein n=1 Tax=Nocardiopsis aegyptia TaxID=220378 RepID=A0A7Z0EVC3_9ACTN|nr:hypothetical protein [Nocardiopsis aegyptia]
MNERAARFRARWGRGVMAAAIANTCTGAVVAEWEVREDSDAGHCSSRAKKTDPSTACVRSSTGPAHSAFRERPSCDTGSARGDLHGHREPERAGETRAERPHRRPAYVHPHPRGRLPEGPQRLFGRHRLQGEGQPAGRGDRPPVHRRHQGPARSAGGPGNEAAARVGRGGRCRGAHRRDRTQLRAAVPDRGRGAKPRAQGPDRSRRAGRERRARERLGGHDRLCRLRPARRDSLRPEQLARAARPRWRPGRGHRPARPPR